MPISKLTVLSGPVLMRSKNSEDRRTGTPLQTEPSILILRFDTLTTDLIKRLETLRILQDHVTLTFCTLLDVALNIFDLDLLSWCDKKKKHTLPLIIRGQNIQ